MAIKPKTPSERKPTSKAQAHRDMVTRKDRLPSWEAVRHGKGRAAHRGDRRHIKSVMQEILDKDVAIYDAVTGTNRIMSVKEVMALKQVLLAMHGNIESFKLIMKELDHEGAEQLNITNTLGDVERSILLEAGIDVSGEGEGLILDVTPMEIDSGAERETMEDSRMRDLIG